METFSALLDLCVGNSPVTGVFPSQRSVTWSFDVFFDLCLNKRLSKQSRHWGAVQYRISVRTHLKLKFRQISFVHNISAIIQSSWNFAQSRTVSLSVQNFKMIGQLRQMLWTNEILRDLSLRWVSEGYPILHSAPGDLRHQCPQYHVTVMY